MIEHYIRGFEEGLREIRHQIHENPELGLQEFKTSALVAEKLRQSTRNCHSTRRQSFAK